MTQKRRPLWNPSELRLFAQSEQAVRCAIANTGLPHGHANDLCQQRFGELAYLGMLVDDGGQRTTEASNDDFVTRVLQLHQTTEILQDANCNFQTLSSSASVGTPESGAQRPQDAGQRRATARLSLPG